MNRFAGYRPKMPQRRPPRDHVVACAAYMSDRACARCGYLVCKPDCAPVPLPPSPENPFRVGDVLRCRSGVNFLRGPEQLLPRGQEYVVKLPRGQEYVVNGAHDVFVSVDGITALWHYSGFERVSRPVEVMA